MASLISKRRRDAAPPEGYDNIHWFVLFTFFSYVFQWFLQLGARIPFFATIRLELLLALFLVVLALMTPRQKPPEGSNLYAYIAWYFLVVSLSLTWSYDFTNSWTIYVDRFVKFSFMAFFIVVFVRSPA